MISPDGLALDLQHRRTMTVLDVRPVTAFTGGQILGSVNRDLASLLRPASPPLPQRDVRTVVIDDDGGALGDLAAAILRSRGATDVLQLQGGIEGWRRSGRRVHTGMALEMKAFGGWAARTFRPPRMRADDLCRQLAAGADIAVLDVRTSTEFAAATIPGATHAPLGDIVADARRVASSPATAIVVTCISLTRGTLAAQTLIEGGFPNPVFVLEGGLMAWRLAGGDLTTGAPADLTDLPTAPGHPGWCDHRADLAAVVEDRVLLAFDVRTSDDDGLGLTRVSGGELIHAGEVHLGVRHPLVILIDEHDGSRASNTARWMRRFDQATLLCLCADHADAVRHLVEARKPLVEPNALASGHRSRTPHDNDVMVDISPSASYEAGHPVGAVWRSAAGLVRAGVASEPVLLTSTDGLLADVVATHLNRLGFAATAVPGGNETLAAAGHPFEPGVVDAAEDVVLSTFRNGQGDLAEMAWYLEWEEQLYDEVADEPAVAFGAAYREA